MNRKQNTQKLRAIHHITRGRGDPAVVRFVFHARYMEVIVMVFRLSSLLGVFIAALVFFPSHTRALPMTVDIKAIAAQSAFGVDEVYYGYRRRYGGYYGYRRYGGYYGYRRYYRPRYYRPRYYRRYRVYPRYYGYRYYRRPYYRPYFRSYGRYGYGRRYGY